MPNCVLDTNRTTDVLDPDCRLYEVTIADDSRVEIPECEEVDGVWTAGDGASFGFADWGQSANPAFPDTGSPTNEGGALRAQDLETSGDPVALNGALIRVDAATGAPVPGNPLFGTAASANAQRIVAYGLRNPFRMTVRAGRNEPWIGDVGWNTWEEVNRLPDVVAAAPTVPWNFGWPCFEGAGTMGDYAGRAICTTLAGGGGFSAHRPPFFAYNHSGQGSAVSGLAFHEPANWPATWDNALFVADYSRAHVYVLRDVDGNGDPEGWNRRPSPSYSVYRPDGTPESEYRIDKPE